MSLKFVSKIYKNKIWVDEYLVNFICDLQNFKLNFLSSQLDKMQNFCAYKIGNFLYF